MMYISRIQQNGTSKDFPKELFIVSSPDSGACLKIPDLTDAEKLLGQNPIGGFVSDTIE